MRTCPSLSTFRHQLVPHPCFRTMKAWSCHQGREALVRSACSRGPRDLGWRDLSAGRDPRRAPGTRLARTKVSSGVSRAPEEDQTKADPPASRLPWAPGSSGAGALSPLPPRVAGWDGALTEHSVLGLAQWPGTQTPLWHLSAAPRGRASAGEVTGSTTDQKARTP